MSVCQQTLSRNSTLPSMLIASGLLLALVSGLNASDQPTEPPKDRVIDRQGVPGAPFVVTAVLRHDDALNEAHDVELLGNLAFVPGKGGSIAIVDIEDPKRPELIWFRRDADALPDAETVLLSGTRLFLGTKDFHSIDITDPQSPRFEAVVADRAKINRINGMVRRGDHIFAANKDGWINVFDVADPQTPQLADALETRQRYDVGWPHDIDLMGPYIVVADPQRFGALDKEGKLVLFRVFADDGGLLSAPSWELTGVVSSRELTGANRVQVVGRYAYVAASRTPASSQGAPCATGVVVDLASPEQPRQVASVGYSDLRGPNGLTVAGRVWFLAGGQTIEAYDISKPAKPRRLAVFHSVEAFPTADDNAHDLVYRDGYLYVSGQGDNSFIIVRIQDPKILQLAEDSPRITQIGADEL